MTSVVPQMGEDRAVQARYDSELRTSIPRTSSAPASSAGVFLWAELVRVVKA